VARWAAGFPGDLSTGVLDDSGDVEERLASLAGDEPCPALDPATGTCDLYDDRPLTCRTFGPAVRLGGEAAGICELCYQGATVEQLRACIVDVDPGGLENALLDTLAQSTGRCGETLVAFALLLET
jgi:Fe-S-cluster containining protein